MTLRSKSSSSRQRLDTSSDLISEGSQATSEDIERSKKNFGDTHLTRSEKSPIRSSNTKFMDILYENLSEAEKAKIIAMQRLLQSSHFNLEALNSNIISTNPIITLMPESNHQSDHRSNTQELAQMINDGKIDSSTVICIERKEYGVNFGMQDIILLANLIEHNQNTSDTAITIPAKIKNSLIYQDAVLYNAAKKHGVEVVGIEGKELLCSKKSPEYNATREVHMAERIEQIVEFHSF